jgi:hypothetical protein
MRANRTSGSMSGRWKRGMVRLVRHRQTKEPATDRPHLTYRATARLYRQVFAKCLELGASRQASLWFLEQGLELPVRRYGLGGWETVWRRPTLAMLNRILRSARTHRLPRRSGSRIEYVV